MTTPLAHYSRMTRAWGQRALGWWTAELAGMLPPSLRTAIDAVRRPPIVLDVAPGQLSLRIAARAQPGPTILPIADPGSTETLAEVRRVLAKNDVQETTAVIRFDPRLLLVTGLDLPSAAEASLGSIIEHQLERLVPLPARDIVYRHRVLHRGTSAKGLRVQVVIIKRSALDRAVQAAQGLGLKPRTAIGMLGEPGDATSRRTIEIWQADRTAGRGRHRRILEVAIACLLVAAYALHLHQLDGVRDELETAITAARQEAASAQTLSRSVGQMDASIAFFERRRGDPPPLQIIDSLTRLVPEDSWVSQLTLRGRSVEITGLSRHATELIPAIEGSELFENPKFRAAITQAPDGKSQRFVLAFEIKSPDSAAQALIVAKQSAPRGSVP